jgi:uncharacterized protein YndB with AHSA1/START domain
MTPNVAQAAHTLCITRVIAATPRDVFDAWTDPGLLANWFAPAPGFTTTVHAIDVRVGGSYRIEMLGPDGTKHTAIGEYRDVVPGARLVITWRWAERTDMQDTLVTLEFRPRGNATELVLTHSLFVAEDDRDHHEKGWCGCITQLEALLGRAV